MTTAMKEIHFCISCGISISGIYATSFECPDCNAVISRCAKCKKQSNPYNCPQCNFGGP